MPEPNNNPGFQTPDEGISQEQTTGTTPPQEPQQPTEPQASQHFLDDLAEVYGEDIVNSYKERIPLDENGNPNLQELGKMVIESQQTIGRLGTQLGEARRELTERQPQNTPGPGYYNPQAHQPNGYSPQSQPQGGMAAYNNVLKQLGYDPQNYDGYLSEQDLAMMARLTDTIANNAVRNSYAQQEQQTQKQMQQNLQKIDRMSEYVVGDLMNDPSSGIDAMRISEIKNAITSNPNYLNRFMDMARQGQWSQDDIKNVVLEVNNNLDKAQQQRLQKALKGMGPTQQAVQHRVENATQSGLSNNVGRNQPANNPSAGDGLLMDASKYPPHIAEALKDYGLAE